MYFRRVLCFGSSTKDSRYGPNGLATTSLILESMVDNDMGSKGINLLLFINYALGKPPATTTCR